MAVPNCPKCGGTVFLHIYRAHGGEQYTMVYCQSCGAVVGTFR